MGFLKRNWFDVLRAISLFVGSILLFMGALNTGILGGVMCCGLSALGFLAFVVAVDEIEQREINLPPKLRVDVKPERVENDFEFDAISDWDQRFEASEKKRVR